METLGNGKASLKKLVSQEELRVRAVKATPWQVNLRMSRATLECLVRTRRMS
jgi:hypothetical protein